MVIGRTVRLVSSVGRAPDLQAGGRGFESCIGHTFSSLVYFSALASDFDFIVCIRSCPFELNIQYNLSLFADQMLATGSHTLP